MIIALAATLALLQDEARAQWEGFAEGSFVVVRMTESMGEKQRTSVQKFTVGKLEGDTLQLRVVVDGKAADRPFSLKKDTAAKRVGTEKIDIDGRTFECALWETQFEDAKRKRTVREWYHKDVPGRLVKSEIVTKLPKGEFKASGRVTRLDQRLVVAGKAVNYCIYEYSGGNEDMTGTLVRWVSEQVPGLRVREEMRQTDQLGKEVLMVTELVDFEVK